MIIASKPIFQSLNWKDKIFFSSKEEMFVSFLAPIVKFEYCLL